jgi:hypothetical protein
VEKGPEEGTKERSGRTEKEEERTERKTGEQSAKSGVF